MTKIMSLKMVKNEYKMIHCQHICSCITQYVHTLPWMPGIMRTYWAMHSPIYVVQIYMCIHIHMYRWCNTNLLTCKKLVPPYLQYLLLALKLHDFLRNENMKDCGRIRI